MHAKNKYKHIFNIKIIAIIFILNNIILFAIL